MFATARACLKKAFRELRVPVCGRFYPNEGGVAGYGNRMRVKYTAKWGLQISEMIFQARSKTQKVLPVQWAAYPDILFYPLEDQARLPFITLPFLILNLLKKQFSEHSLCHDKKPKFNFIIKPSTTVCQFLYKFSSLIYNSGRCLFF